MRGNNKEENLPGYIKLFETSKLKQIKEVLGEKLSCCNLCPRHCSVNRLKEKKGFCRTGRNSIVNSFFLHFGEEKELVGRGGSGTIFFSFCNLDCLYCQNYPLSHWGEGREVTPEDLSQMMLSLQEQGAENINFVTPTHTIASIIEGLYIAVKKGLKLPLVYNCGGYEEVETLKLIEGVFDIYMPDIKYSDNMQAEKYSRCHNYFEITKKAVLEMHRQVGDLIIEDGVAKRGLLIRHLILPGDISGAREIIDFLASRVSKNTYINIMFQYRPCFEAYKYKELNRFPTREEKEKIISYAQAKGLWRGFLNL